MPERTLVLILLTAVIAAAWFAGALLVSWLVDRVPSDRRARLLALWLVAFLLLALPQSLRENFVHSRHVTYWSTLLGDGPVYSMFLFGWFWSLVKSRRARED